MKSKSKLQKRTDLVKLVIQKDNIISGCIDLIQSATELNEKNDTIILEAFKKKETEQLKNLTSIKKNAKQMLTLLQECNHTNEETTINLQIQTLYNTICNSYNNMTRINKQTILKDIKEQLDDSILKLNYKTKEAYDKCKNDEATIDQHINSYKTFEKYKFDFMDYSKKIESSSKFFNECTNLANKIKQPCINIYNLHQSLIIMEKLNSLIPEIKSMIKECENFNANYKDDYENFLIASCSLKEENCKNLTQNVYSYMKKYNNVQRQLNKTINKTQKDIKTIENYLTIDNQYLQENNLIKFAPLLEQTKNDFYKIKNDYNIFKKHSTKQNTNFNNNSKEIEKKISYMKLKSL